ncbi:MAG: FtsX-like permease family protein [Pseudomonadota bacterium]|nr:FtsX-like permease family protein [Pseudomonadota bacterium]
MKQIILALRLLLRDWRSGHLNLLLIALLVAVTTHNTIGFHSERIENAMELQASNLLGGDLVIKSPVPLDQLPELPNTVRFARAVEFSSVVMADEGMQLTSIKAVSDQYPLKTPLKVSDQSFEPDYESPRGPGPGQAWVESRLLNVLGIQIGDQVDVGDTRLTVEKVLTFEPDRGGSFYSFVPRLMMNQSDLGAANLIQTGSRVEYYYQFAGPESAIANVRATLTPSLQPGQNILSIHSRQRTVSAALNRAEGYLQLASLMAILLASVALAMGAQHFSETRYDTAALLRCFGLRSNQILLVFTSQLIALGLISALLGGALGWLLHFSLVEMLSGLLPRGIPLPSARPFFSGLILALVILIGFSLPALVQLQRTSPLRVLRRDLTPSPLSKSLLYGIVLMLIGGLMLWYTRDPVLIAAIILGSLLAWIVTYGLTVLFGLLINQISKRSSLSLQAGLRNLSRRRLSTRVQLLGFGLTAMAMLVILLVRGELINTWQQQLPEQAPNHFVLNVLPHEADAFEQHLQANNILSQPLYPIVRGRLTHINQAPMQMAVTKESGSEEEEEALNRELNLSWAEALPSDNRIIEGQWWDTLPADTGARVSIEQRLAQRLGVQLGDVLTFFVANQTFTAEVASIRSVKWESFQPNFYLMFNPGALDGLPVTYLTSFHLEPARKALLKPLVQRFPAITLLEVDVILRQVRTILDQVSAAVEFILLFVLAAGLTITLATLITTMPQRYREGAIMRTLGATRRQLILQQWSEFFAIGALSGLVAGFGAEMARLAIYLKLLALPYTPNPWIWIIVPPLMGLVIGLAGQISSQRILKQSPAVALRE